MAAPGRATLGNGSTRQGHTSYRLLRHSAAAEGSLQGPESERTLPQVISQAVTHVWWTRGPDALTNCARCFRRGRRPAATTAAAGHNNHCCDYTTVAETTGQYLRRCSQHHVNYSSHTSTTVTRQHHVNYSSHTSTTVTRQHHVNYSSQTSTTVTRQHHVRPPTPPQGLFWSCVLKSLLEFYMLQFLAIFCLLAATSPCRGLGLNEFEKGTILSNSSPIKMYAGSLVACATECSRAEKCVSFYWEPKPEQGAQRCNLIRSMGYFKEIPAGTFIFRPKKYALGRIISYPSSQHSWRTAKDLCTSHGLRFMPAPTTLEQLYIFNNFEGFIDAYKDATLNTVTDSDGNVLDKDIVLKYLHGSSPAEGCIGIAESNTRTIDCDEIPSLPMQPLCLLPEP
ncbi:hypothetical protein FHG87_013483 [Trinorchestia longiramus]|nr:hypothetical protein FHG87_013483 [Trinorchestia longiramus]